MVLGLMSGVLGGLGCITFHVNYPYYTARWVAGIWTGVVVSGARGWWAGRWTCQKGLPNTINTATINVVLWNVGNRKDPQFSRPIPCFYR